MANKPARIILDTNLWISFLLKKDFSKLDILIKKQKATLLFSKELLDEFIEVVQRPVLNRFFSQKDLHAMLTVIDEAGEFIEVTSKVTICRDPKDNFLLSLAKDGHADYLITGDKDLLVLNRFGDTKIAAMKEYLTAQ